MKIHKKKQKGGVPRQYDINFILIRHAMTCANLLNKGLGRTQLDTSKYAADTDINRLGIEQCLQLSDFLLKNDKENRKFIDGNAEKINQDPATVAPVTTIFCCSELIRTNETLFLSLNNYLKDYIGNGQKVLVIPWLNEFSAQVLGKPLPAGVRDEDNYPEDVVDRRESWKKFILKLRDYFGRYVGDLGRASWDVSKMYLEDDWGKIFHLSEKIYKPSGGNFTDEGRITKFNLRDINQCINNLGEILDDYLDKFTTITSTSVKINLVMVSHSGCLKNFLNTICPQSKVSLEKQQILNCELIKLPTYNLQKRAVVSFLGNFLDCRLFPVGFYNTYVKEKGRIFYDDFDSGLINRYFIFYASNFNLFFSLFNVTKQITYKTDGKDTRYLEDDKIFSDPAKRVEIGEPMKQFLEMNYYDYLKEFGKEDDGMGNGGILKTLTKLAAYYKNVPDLYYDYGKLLEIIDNNHKELHSMIDYFKDYFKNKIKVDEPNIEGMMRGYVPTNNSNTEVSKILGYIIKRNSDFFKRVRTVDNRVKSAKSERDKKIIMREWKAAVPTISEVYAERISELHTHFFGECKQELIDYGRANPFMESSYLKKVYGDLGISGKYKRIYQDVKDKYLFK